MLSEECSLPDTHTTLHRLGDVMRDQHSVLQVDRQLILLDTYLLQAGSRITLADLKLVCNVMEFLVNKVDVGSRYQKPFQAILDMMKYPPVMDVASDELFYKHHIVDLFTSLGWLLLQTKDTKIKSQLLEIVQITLIAKRPTGSNMVPIRACIQGIEVSEFMECLADFLAIVGEEMYHWTIYTALQTCKLSVFCCWALLKKNVIETLLVRLTTVQDEAMVDVLDTTWELLWRLFGCTNHPEDWLKVTAPSRIALRSLRYVLRQEALVHAHPGRNPISMNNVAAIILKLMHIFPHAEYVLSDIFEDITFFATLTEAPLQIHILPYFKNEHYHLQFKKMMLACLALSPISNLSIMLFDQYKVAECLVAMMRGGKCGGVACWNPDNSLELFRCVIPVVCALFDCLHKSFINAGLLKMLIKFLTDRYLQKGNRPDDLSHQVIKTLSSICARKTCAAVTLNSLIQANAVPVLIQWCEFILKPGYPLTTASQSMLFHSLCILTKLMTNQKELQNEYAESSFTIITYLYQIILKPLQGDSLIDNKLIVAVSNFAWEVIVWNKDNVSKMFSTGMVFSHIDILERSPFSVQLLCLSLLVDLCEYPECIPYLVSWRGRKGVKLLSVLCKIWRVEEERLKVPKDEQGCISDIEAPLMGDSQLQLSKRQTKKAVAVCDVFGSARPKIYAIVQLLHRYKNVRDICEEHYRLGHDMLPREDLVTMSLVEAYLPLKMGEIWWDIRNKQQAVLPLDRYLAETLTDRYLDWSLRVQRAQHTVLREHDDRLRGEEQEYYSLARSGHLTSALEALREVMTIAQTADRQLLLSSHQKLRECIEKSRAAVDVDLRVAYPHDVNVILVNNNTDIVVQNEPGHSSPG